MLHTITIRILSIATLTKHNFIIVNCGPRDSAPLVEKKIGKKYPLVCEDSCDDGVYNYSVYNVATGETEIVHQGSYRYHFDVNGDGIYCCACADNPIALATNSQCCVHIVGKQLNIFNQQFYLLLHQ